MSATVTAGFGEYGAEGSFFTDRMPDGQERLAAAVFQLGLPPDRKGFHVTSPMRRVGLSSPWRMGIFSKLILAEMFVRMLFRKRERPAFPEMPDGPAGFNSSTGIGESQVLYSGERRIVRVAGQDIAVPDDSRTLVVMVRHHAPPGLPEVATQLVPVPPSPEFRFDRTVDRKAMGAAMGAHMRRRQLTWDSAIREDPVVRAFLESGM